MFNNKPDLHTEPVGSNPASTKELMVHLCGETYHPTIDAVEGLGTLLSFVKLVFHNDGIFLGCHYLYEILINYYFV